MKKNNPCLTPVVFVFGLFMLNFQCNKDYDLPPVKYTFSEKTKLISFEKAYGINDTIWIEFLKTDKRLKDIKSGQSISLDTGAIDFGLNIKPLYNTPARPADGYGDFVVFDAAKVDTFNHDVFGIFVQKQCSEPDFHFKIGYIPKHRGYYALPLGRNSVSSCRGSGTSRTLFAEIIYGFNIANSGKDIYLQIPEADRKQYAHTYLEYGLDGDNVYVFKVD